MLISNHRASILLISLHFLFKILFFLLNNTLLLNNCGPRRTFCYTVRPASKKRLPTPGLVHFINEKNVLIVQDGLTHKNQFMGVKTGGCQNGTATKYDKIQSTVRHFGTVGHFGIATT